MTRRGWDGGGAVMGRVCDGEGLGWGRGCDGGAGMGEGL